MFGLFGEKKTQKKQSAATAPASAPLRPNASQPSAAPAVALPTFPNADFDVGLAALIADDALKALVFVAPVVSVNLGAAFADARLVELRGGGEGLGSHGHIQGFSLRLPDALEAKASGKRVRVSILARSLSGAPTTFGLAYSTNEVGNSGWIKFEAGPDFAVHSFEYDVAPMVNGNGDYVGVLPSFTGTDGIAAVRIGVEVLPRSS